MRKPFFYLVSFLIIFSCQNSKSSRNEDEPSEISVPNNNPEIVETELEKEPTYEFSYRGVEEHFLGDPLDYIERNTDFINKVETRTFEDEGERYEEHFLEISDQHGKLFDVVYDEQMTRPFIEKFILHSERLKNNENIGVGNTLNDFFKAYPDSKIYFSYMGDGDVWLDNGYLGYQFVLEKPKDFFDKVLIEHDGRIEIKHDVFNGNEKITSIHIFGAPEIENLSGIWSSEDESVSAAFNKKEHLYHIELSTGKDIYNQFSQDLIPFYNFLYSSPSENAYIEVLTETYPEYILLTLDDNEELEPLKIKLFPKQKYNLQ